MIKNNQIVRLSFNIIFKKWSFETKTLCHSQTFSLPPHSKWYPFCYITYNSHTLKLNRPCKIKTLNFLRWNQNSFRKEPHSIFHDTAIHMRFDFLFHSAQVHGILYNETVAGRYIIRDRPREYVFFVFATYHAM